MSCRRAEEIDLMAFATDRRASEWADFRAHYPSCPECSRAVAELTSFESQLRDLREDAGSAHLGEAEMIAFEDDTIDPVERRRIDLHLEDCSQCRTEMTVLRSFALPGSALAAAVSEHETLADVRDVSESPRPSRVSAEPESSWIKGLRDFVSGLLQPVPAFGLAAAALLAAVYFWSIDRADGVDPGPQYVEENPELAPVPEIPKPIEFPEPPSDSPRERRERNRNQLAEEGALPPVPHPEQEAPSPRSPSESTPHSGTQLAETPTEVPARVPPAPDRPAPTPVPFPDEGLEEGPGIMLLAALLPDEMPAYARPRGAHFDALEAMRVGSNLRAVGPDGPKLSVLAPSHLGATRLASPRLYWALDQPTEMPIELVVIDPDADDPLFERLLPGPHTAGLHAIDLAREGIQLEVGTVYEWSVALIPKRNARSNDIVSQAGIERRPALATGSSSATAERAREIHRLAEGGDWYDAFDQTLQWLGEAPETEALVKYRRALLDQAGLAGVEKWIVGD